MSDESDTKPEAKRSAPKQVFTEDLKTPAEWARVFNQVRPHQLEQTSTKLNGKPFDQVGEFLWPHEAAAMLHGWALHEHHAGTPMKLSRADYEAALKAASQTDSRGEYQPHVAALSPHKGA